MMIELAAVIAAAVAGLDAPARLRCDYLVNPCGIDAIPPRLSWEFRDDRRNAAQSAYQIVAASSPEHLDRPDLWDSGRIASGETMHIAYGGPAPASAQRIHWRVRTWDGAGIASPWSEPAQFTMGLLHPGDWTAHWIGIPGAGTPGTRAHNGYHSDLAPTPDAPKWVTIDLGQPRPIDGVTLFPARPHDWIRDEPGFLFPLRYRIEASRTPDFAAAEVVADRTTADQPSPGASPVELRFPPTEARYVRLTATHLRDRAGRDFGLALAEMQVNSGGENIARGAPASALDSIEHNDWSTSNLTDGDTTSHKGTPPDRGPCPMFRGEFIAADAPARALLFITARGLYDCRVNGERVGDHQLAPEWTDYAQRIQYQAYDITERVRRGGNAIAVTLGHGWYAGRIGLFSAEMYGSQLSLLAQVRLEMPDGSVRTIGSDGSWKASNDGPIRRSDMLDGEAHDARRRMPGWDRPGFDDSAWMPVRLIDPPGAALVAQPNEPIRATRELRPVSISEPSPGVFVVDLGQNMPGWVRLRTSGPAGTEVNIRHAEALTDDGRAYTANLRSAGQRDTFILAGRGEEVFEPRFVYHGFRFAEITGLATPPTPDSITGIVVHSDSPSAGEFQCSDPTINQLMRNILWTQHANMMSVPTDCPQRDERLGWMGDAQIFAPTGCMNLDMAAFWSKWARDVRDAQDDQGRYSDVSPNPVKDRGQFMAAPGWGDAGVIVPWCAWTRYADDHLAREHLPSALAWIDYVRRHSPEGIWTTGRGNDYGDWLNSDTLRLDGLPRVSGELSKEAFATACHARSARLLADLASAAGDAEAASTLRSYGDGIAAAWAAKYIGPDGNIEGETQAGYALALHWDLAPAALRPRLVERLLDAVAAYDGHLSTGFQSTLPLMEELVAAGRADMAYALIQQRSPPSWAYMIEQGATTIWERWDGYVRGRGFQDPGMNSLNHFAFGSVGEWVWRHIGGISPLEPGFRRIAIAPTPGGGISSARASHRCILGEIRTAWEVREGFFTLEATIPPGAIAEVSIPARRPDGIEEGGLPLDRSVGIGPMAWAAGRATFTAAAGTYRFRSRVP